MKFYIADKTGKIVRRGNASLSQITCQRRGDETLKIGDCNPDTQYVLAGKLTSKPAMPITIHNTTILSNGVDTSTVSGIPAGAGIEFDGEEFTADGTDLTITVDAPGVYTLIVKAFPYLDFAGDIHAD